MTGTAWLILAAVVVISAWVVTQVVTEPVPFERLDRFARRQRLRITPTNAAVVMRYLGTTHRWRTAGLATALCYTVAAGLRHNTLTLQLAGVFTGWFMGAVVAEWRLNAPPPGTRRQARQARLVPRRRAGYLGPSQRVLPWVLAAAALGVGVVNLTHQAGDRYAPRAQTLATIAAVVLTITAAVVVGRHIVRRPQAAALDDDVRMADDALRTRSLRVLTGSTVALLTTAAATLIAVSPVLDAGTARGTGITVLALGTIAGWYVAVAPRRATRGVGMPPAGPQATP